MIDLENEIYTLVTQELKNNFAGIFTTGKAQNGVPAKIPCVSVIEVDNASPKAKIDSSGVEKYSDLAYLISAYSNKASGEKQQCKDIMKVADSVMFGLNFTRESKTPEIPLNDGKIYWQSARYVARTDGIYIYRK